MRQGRNVGGITTTATATSYNTTSDDRLKEDLQSFDAGNIVDDTEVYDFKWKSTGERAYGVIAQQAIEVYPAAVTHTEKNDWWGSRLFQICAGAAAGIEGAARPRRRAGRRRP